MKVLVTGYKGFIGQNMTAYLETENIEWFGYEWGELDYDLTGIDRVIHLGAVTDTTFDDIPTLLEKNYYFTTKLIDECTVRNIPLQIASSASVYGVNNTTFRENDPPAPMNHYAWSKFMVEEYFRGSKKSKAPIQIFRYFNVYGPGEEHKGHMASPFHKFTQQAKKGEIKLFEGSDNFARDFIPVRDILKLHTRFFNVSVSGIWNFGTGTPRTFLDVAMTIARSAKCKISYVKMPDKLKASYQSFTCADMTKTYDTLAQYET